LGPGFTRTLVIRSFFLQEQGLSQRHIGQVGARLIETMIAGKQDPEILSELAQRRLKNQDLVRLKIGDALLSSGKFFGVFSLFFAARCPSRQLPGVKEGAPKGHLPRGRRLYALLPVS